MYTRLPPASFGDIETLKLDLFGKRYFVIDSEMKAPPVPVAEWSWKPFDAAEADRFHLDDEPVDVSVQTNYRPTESRQDVVLVFSTGVLNRHLLHWLPKHGLKYFYLDFDDFPDIGTISIDVSSDLGAILKAADSELHLSDVAAVVWTAPHPWRVPPATELSNESIFFERWRQVLRDLRGLIRPDAIWLPSHPFNGSPEWQNKLSELVGARKAGLRVPETLCTSDPAAAKAFLDRYPGEVLFREFTVGGNGIPPRPVHPDDMGEALQSLRTAPCTFQRYVDKEFEVRALVVGEKIFACKIDSSASERARLDWRVYDNANVPWSRMELPKNVEASIFKFLDGVSLKWACVDLIKGKDGEFYFLEANRPGSSAWFLAFVGLDTAKEIALYLSEALAK